MHKTPAWFRRLLSVKLPRAYQCDDGLWNQEVVFAPGYGVRLSACTLDELDAKICGAVARRMAREYLNFLDADIAFPVINPIR